MSMECGFKVQDNKIVCRYCGHPPAERVVVTGEPRCPSCGHVTPNVGPLRITDTTNRGDNDSRRSV